MLTRRDLERLLALTENPVLSVYLHTDPAQDPKASYRIWLKDALKGLAERVPGGEKKRFQELAERAQAHVRDHRPRGKSWVAFLGPNTEEAFDLRVPVENEVHWGHPELTPLVWLLEEYPPYAVIWADSEHLRFFVVAMNEIRELDERALELDTHDWRRKDLPPPGGPPGSAIRGAVRGGNQRDAFEGRVQAHIERFWRQAQEVLRRLREEQGVEGFLLAGPKAVRDRFLQTLGPEARRMIGSISLPREVSLTDLMEASAKAIQAHERAQEEKLVDALLLRASTSERAGVGLPATLQALQEGRVDKVIVNRRFDAPLKECARCGHVYPPDGEACPRCAASEHRETSLRAMLPILAHRHGAEVEVIRAPAAERLALHGGIGALWRY